MPVSELDLLQYKAAEMSNAATNGGRMSANVVTTNVKGNIWPNVTQAERAAGATHYRKIFQKNANATDIAYQNAACFIENFTPGDDYVVMFAGTQTNTQADLTGAERLYGTGQLASDVSIGATSVIVNVETGVGALGVFADGDVIRISNQDGVNDITGYQEYATIDAGGVSPAGDQITLTLTAPLNNAFLSVDTRVSATIQAGTIEGLPASFSIASASGTYDDTTYPPEIDFIGGVEQVITITVTSVGGGTINFSAVSDVLGSLGSGTNLADFSPTNPDFAVPYFTLRSAGWGGTWLATETIIFTSHPSAYPLWLKRVIPAGAASLAANSVRFATEGESA